MIDLKHVKRKDPVKPQGEKGAAGKEMSPFDPPGAYEYKGDVEQVPFEKMPRMLQKLMDEHHESLKEMEAFEKAMITFKQKGWQQDEAGNKAFKRFFSFLDDTVFQHNRKEEKFLFPLLDKRLKETGEHSQAWLENDPRTSVDLIEDDHVKFVQLGALAFNFLGLAPRLSDPASRAVVYDLAYEQSRELIEKLRLHIYREDEILFPLACKYIHNDEFPELEEEMAQFE